MKGVVTHAIAVAIGVAIALLIFKACPGKAEKADINISEISETRTDTVRAVSPQAMDLIRVRFEPVKLPEVRIGEWGSAEGVKVTLEDDSIKLDIPVERKVYTDDSTYRAVVSGFMASLDTIDVYRRVVERTVTINRETVKFRRWGLSVGVGLTATPAGRIEPGLFAGVSYTFLTF